MRRILFNIIFLFMSSAALLAGNDKNYKIYGVTIDDISNIDDITLSLKQMSKKPTARIVFDENMPSSYYSEAVTKIGEVSFVMGEILDSYCFKNYGVNAYSERVIEYINAFGDKVDIWEIANEINGEWLGNSDTVVKKMTNAFRIAKDKGKVTAVTFYYNKECYENPESEMFKWINDKVPLNMKDSLDYVFVSYYEDDCEDLQPDWQIVFDSLHLIFPNSKIGIGECGTKFKEKKKSYMKRYYNMDINTPNFVGGYFWWYYKQDCVPYSKKLWKTLNSIIERIQ